MEYHHYLRDSSTNRFEQWKQILARVLRSPVRRWLLITRNICSLHGVSTHVGYANYKNWPHPHFQKTFVFICIWYIFINTHEYMSFYSKWPEGRHSLQIHGYRFGLADDIALPASQLPDHETCLSGFSTATRTKGLNVSGLRGKCSALTPVAGRQTSSLKVTR